MLSPNSFRLLCSRCTLMVQAAEVVLVLPEQAVLALPATQTLAETLGLPAGLPVLVVWVARGPLETEFRARVLPLEIAEAPRT